MKTSYYASKLWHGLNAVAISRGVPKWFQGSIYTPLAPTWEMVHMQDMEEYTRRYREQILAKLSPSQVLEDLGEDAVLLCYEKPGDFCHRRLVAEWLEEELGLEVPELGQEVKIEQISLF